jgi:LysM repeat protein
MRRVVLILWLCFFAFGLAHTSAQPPAPSQHTVQAGETLFSIAQRYGVDVNVLAALNGLSDPNRLQVGQVLLLPAPLAGGQGGALPSADIVPVPAPSIENQAPTVSFALGLHADFAGQEAEALLTRFQALGATWVNQKIDWALYESTQGTLNFEALDALILPLDAAGLNILLTVTNAPAWARTGSLDQSPPSDFATYGLFVRRLAEQYEGVVDAYQVWDSPNLRAQWSDAPLSPAAYVRLLEVAYVAIKTSDPRAIVVSAGLTPSVVNDGQSALNDREFLRGMYAAGLANVSDAIGVYADSAANPPDSSCCLGLRPAVIGFDDKPAYFFLDTLRDYRAIQNEYNDGATFLWVTRFGWGSADYLTGVLNPENAYLDYTSPLEQGQYLARAFALGHDLTYVGPMFLNNLNFCATQGAESLACAWSLLDAQGEPRRAFELFVALTAD